MKDFFVKYMKKLKKFLKNSDKKWIEKMLIILVIINFFVILLYLFTNILSLNKIIKMIFNSLIGVINIIFILFIMKKNDENDTEVETENEIKYSPLILDFFNTSEIRINYNLIIAELLNLKERGLLEIEQSGNDTVYTLKSENFIRMNGVERVELNQIEMYAKEGILPYENLYITKILFPFENTVTLKEIKRKCNEGYYQERLEMSQVLLGKMLEYELENKNWLGKSKSKKFSIIVFLNVLVSVFTWMALGIFNIVLFIGAIANLLISTILLKNENIFAYNFNSEITEYIEKLKNYVETLEGQEVKGNDLILKLIFEE